jgi:predicted nuclease with TOPRIM domain
VNKEELVEEEEEPLANVQAVAEKLRAVKKEELVMEEEEEQTAYVYRIWWS